MKVFISYAPQQEEGKLMKNVYEPNGNERLRFRETRFPILAAINGYADPGETIRVILIVQDKDSCRYNAGLFEEELKELLTERGILCSGVEALPAAFDDSVAAHIQTFGQLAMLLKDDDEIFACLTYGSKPSPMVELSALRYARMLRKNTAIRCIVYGQRDWATGEQRIYDETALAKLDDAVRALSELQIPDPDRLLKTMLLQEKGEDDDEQN